MKKIETLEPPACPVCKTNEDMVAQWWGFLCHCCGEELPDEDFKVTVGEDCCSQAEAGFECDCGKPREYRGEDRVRGLD